MKRVFLATMALCLIVSLQGAQLVFAQDFTTAPDLSGADYETEIVEHPDGTIEVIRKYKFYEQIKIPKEIFVREIVGYENPILDDEHIMSPQEISRDLFVIGTNAFLSILIFLVVGLACFLFNNVIEAHGDDINKFTKKIPILSLFQGDKLHKKSILKKLFLFVILLLFGLVAAHISPDFNLLEQENLGIVVVTVVAIIIATYAKDIWRLAVARRNDWPAFFKPNMLGLFLAIICVALSRKLEIPPGYLFGIPMGLFIFSKHFNKNEGKFEFSALTWMFFMAIVVWFITPYTAEYEVVFDLFNLLYVILLEGLFFELFPITFLPGKAIFKWSKVAWAFLFGSVSFLLLHTLFNPNSTVSAIADSQPTMNTLIILGIFVLFCFTVWGIARVRLMLRKA
ncbi:hypothetical protein ACFL3C_04075 [Patescibacteria group bacterium]